MSLNHNDVERADEIVKEMCDLLDEFGMLVRQSDSRMLYERFHSYPEGHISMSLTKESNFVGGMFPLSELVEAMRSEVESTTCEECDEVLPEEEFSEDTDGDGICNKCRSQEKEVDDEPAA